MKGGKYIRVSTLNFMCVKIMDEVNTRKIQMRWLKNMVLSKMLGCRVGR